MKVIDRLRAYAGSGRLSVLLTGNIDPDDLPDIARRVTCLEKGDHSCTCPSCRCRKDHPDIEWLDAAVKIDTVRQALAKGDIRPSIGRVRCLIFTGVDRVSDAVANLLLKRLEEDQERQFFILTATSAAEVLPTIRSRCARFSFLADDRQTYEAYCLVNGYSSGLYDFTGGYRSLAEKASHNIAYLQKAQRVIRQGTEKDLLEFFGEMKEKDRNEFIAIHKDIAELVIRLFARELWQTGATEEQVLLIDDIGDLARSDRITRADWLNFLIDWSLAKEKKRGGAA